MLVDSHLYKEFERRLYGGELRVLKQEHRREIEKRIRLFLTFMVDVFEKSEGGAGANEEQWLSQSTKRTGRKKSGRRSSTATTSASPSEAT